MEVSDETASRTGRDLLARHGYRAFRTANSGALKPPLGAVNFENLLFLCPGHPSLPA
jgi:hypothetical protein